MKVELFPFQKKALNELRALAAISLGEYRYTHRPQVVSFTAPTGAGKTIIMASLVESIFFGDENHTDQPEAVFIWLSDSPQLNEQSKEKFDVKADKILLSQCVIIDEESFDREILEDGHIYFLNTQKLGKSGNLTKAGDRNYTIWQTLANTVAEKSDRLYFIIDEAHRGAQERDAGRTLTIMQKFLKGSPDVGLPPMPVVIGMSATTERFDTLVKGLTSTSRKCEVSPDDVRDSGLLKDRVVITYPENSVIAKEMAILQAAADDWKEKCDHWEHYCNEQNLPQVNPVFVVQVQNVGENKISDTDLDECLRKIEERTGVRFKEGEVVHAFGEKIELLINGLKVRYEKPSRISDDHKIKVVFFKESLSTGWDCPRAETMMSFRRAVDSTYIAQLLGRMVRTPLQMRILSDEVLNDVHLFLPNFDETTVKQVIKALQGEVPTYIEPNPRRKELTIHAPKIHTSFKKDNPNQIQIFEYHKDNLQSPDSNPDSKSGSELPVPNPPTPQPVKSQGTDVPPDSFDRTEILKFINKKGIASCEVRDVQISDYVSSMFKMAHLLCQAGLYRDAVKDVHRDIVGIIRHYVERLKQQEKYGDLVQQVKKLELQTRIIDPYGKAVNDLRTLDLFSTSDADVDRQFRIAESRLGNDGVGKSYGKKFYDPDDPNAFKIDVILFTADQERMELFKAYAEKKFHELDDNFHNNVAEMDSEQLTRELRNIVSDGARVSRHNFYLPETIQFPFDKDAKECIDHLFVDKETGTAKIKLNAWEEGTLEEERKREDFVCWIRNSARASWALAIPYEYDNTIKPTYPDLLIVRRKGPGFVIDILEPHMPKFDDNLGKAKGLAEYARTNRGVGRIQLIRQGKDATGRDRFKRLDMSRSETRDRVLHATSPDDLNHIFDELGFFA